MKIKFFGILLSLCLLSFTSCSNNTVSKSVEKINAADNLTSDEEVDIIETSTEKEPKMIVAQETETTLVEVPISSIDFTQFKSMLSSEDYIALESYFPIFSGELKFNYQIWKYTTKSMEMSLNDLSELNTLVKLHMFTILDLDSDGIKELVLCFDNAGEQLIFHKENNNYFATELPYRGFKMLQTNGVYNSSGGAACSHYLKLSFENGEFVEQELGHACTYEDEVYVVNGNPVGEEEFQQWQEEIMTGDVEWYYP